MVVKTSEDVYNFVKECIQIKENQESTSESNVNSKSIDEKKITEDKFQKYNIDYSKFDECINEIENEEELEKERQKEKENNLNNKNHSCNQGHDHSKEKQLYEKKTSEKIEASNVFNEEGKQAFREKKYKLATVYFLKGIIQLDYCFPETEEEQKQYNTLEINLHLNLALTKFHMTKYHECINECNTVLNIDNKNAKAYYRKGQAYMQLDLYKEAKEEFLKASEYNPNDSNVKNALITLKNKIETYNKKKKLVCSKMFLSEEKNNVTKKEEITNEIHENINNDDQDETIEIKKNEIRIEKENNNLNENNDINDKINNYENNIKNNISSKNITEFPIDIQSSFMKQTPINLIMCFIMFLLSIILFFSSFNYTLIFIMAFSILFILFLKPFFSK